jgi:hypothetical protein
LRAAPYDHVVKRPGPGPHKTKGLPIVEQRTVQMWRSADYRWRELFESADVISEGATRNESDGPTYYGSTSVLLPLESRGGRVPDADAGRVLRVIAVDPHARLRAVRIACLEAQLRAGAPIGRIHAELFVRRDERGVRIDVDVEARVFEQGHERSRRRS